MKGSQAAAEAKEKAKALPGIKSVLQKKARKYDPEGDIEINECAICMTEFSVDDPRDLVELACSHQHLFHLQCLE